MNELRSSKFIFVYPTSFYITTLDLHGLSPWAISHLLLTWQQGMGAVLQKPQHVFKDLSELPNYHEVKWTKILAKEDSVVKKLKDLLKAAGIAEQEFLLKNRKILYNIV